MKKSSLLVTLFLLVSLSLALLSAGAQVKAPSTQKPVSKDVFFSEAVPAHVVNIDLRALPAPQAWQPGDPVRDIPRRVYPRAVPAAPLALQPALDPLLALQASAAPALAPQDFATPVLNFEGIPFTGVRPPDTIGEVGPDHYVQMVNGGGGTHVAIFDKAGLPIADFDLDSLWTAGGNCAVGHGDPIVLYDQLASRWLFSEFSDIGDNLCVYISQTSDPVSGGWFLYDFPTPYFPDYPKYAVWPDAYYVSTNEEYPTAYAMDRNQMLAGGAATLVRFEGDRLDGFPFQAFIPSDLDGATPPPAGSPNYFMRHRDDEVHNAGANNPDQDYLEIWEFHIDWASPASSTFTQAQNIAIAEIDSDLCGLESFECFPQPGSNVGLDPLREVIMWRLQYRNFSDYETLVGNLVTDVDGTDHGGIRWFELRKTGTGPWTLYQEGTYAPDAAHRWLGSIAMDASGNIALGYSVSDAVSIYPSIRYTGRMADDPLGTMPQGEHDIMVGSGAQPWFRWGDYSSMNVDPVDDCTFWYTNEYVSDAKVWRTRIAAFRFSGCQTEPQGVLEGVVSDAATSDPIAGVTIQATGSTATHIGATNSRADGVYSMVLGQDTYTVTSASYGYQSATMSGIAVTDGVTTTEDISLTAAPTYVVSGNVTDATTGWPLYAKFTLQGAPFDPPTIEFWNDPVTGYYSVTLAVGVTYNLSVEAWAPGYDAASRTIPPLTADQTQDLHLAADLGACRAPGYPHIQAGIYEQFENGGVAPAGWTIVDNAGTGEVWSFDNPGGRSNLTGGSGDFAIVDSDYYGGDGYQDTELRSPALDFSALSTVTIEFDTDYYTYSGYDVADVDVSNDGGNTWTNVWQKAGASYFGPIRQVLDISSLAAGESDVMVRFHYYDAYYEWWWQVDNVLIGLGPFSCESPTGGLVVGNVYDANTGQGIAGANVANDGDFQATTVVSDGWSVGDGFYTLFSPAGTRAFTATVPLYAAASADVTVVQSDTVRQDLYLDAGMLELALPAHTGTLLGMGLRSGSVFTLTHSGSVAAKYEWVEVAGDYIQPPAGRAPQADAVPWLSIDPITGTLMGGSQVFNLTFDASAVNQPGEYNAQLQLVHDTPYEVPSIPLSMTVPIPADWGELDGYITSLGHCDIHPAVLEGAEVMAVPTGASLGEAITVETNEYGLYRVFLPEGDYDITVSAPGHASQVVADVTITRQALTWLDFDALLSTLPCITQVAWSKQVYVNGQQADMGSLRFPVIPSDTITIVDVVDVTHTGNITFSLEEAWSQSLSLLGYEYNILPGGTVSITGSEVTVLPWDLSWGVTDLPAVWTYVLTKTFSVGQGSSETETIYEELQIKYAQQQPDPVLLTFDLPRDYAIYLPIVFKSSGP